ncbi:MAG: hypothetical protein M3015_15865 [Bacteroidota bacterium]|nr:hypothetical protein [Bacteroidota bacterium]
MANLHVQPKRKNYVWVWIIIIVLIIAAAVYYYENYYKKGVQPGNNNTGLTTWSLRQQVANSDTENSSTSIFTL